MFTNGQANTRGMTKMGISKKLSGKSILQDGMQLIALNVALLLANNAMAAYSPLLISVQDSMIKFRQDQTLVADSNPNIVLSAARNEAETGQILLFAPSGVGKLSVAISPLTHATDKNAHITDGRAFLVHYADIDMPTKTSDTAGAWPDGLVPLTQAFSIKPGKQQSVWLKFKIDKAAKAGLYQGTVTVSQNGGQVAAIPVKLNVWNITLPDTIHLPSVIGLDYGSIKKFDGGTSKISAYYQALADSRAVPIDLFNSNPSYAINNGQSEVNFEPYMQQYRLAYRQKAPLMIPFSMNWPVDSAVYPLFSDEYNQLTVDYLKKTAAYFSSQGLLDQAYVYIGEIDEPKTAEQYALVEGFATILKVADPRLKLLLTIHAECPDCGGKTIDKLDQDNILWAPNITFYDSKAMKLESGLLGLLPKVSAVPSGWDASFSRKLAAQNRPFWWYLNPWTFVTRNPSYKYPNLYIDHQGIEQRIIGWMAFGHDVKVIGFWNATYWQTTTDPWVSVPKGEEGSSIAGDGSLFYPVNGVASATGQAQPDLPITAIRLELLRESSEDYELLYLLKEKGKTEAAKAIANQAAASLQNYLSDADKLKLLREQVADAILQP
ncbi:MAG: DUF4091 domain-containing protein [Methylococcaceae bacterium]|nr:DUF4091 domain-containing protein [Methylococcaceae bacterium]